MEGLFEARYGAPLAIIGMPSTEQRRLLDPIVVPEVLSFLAYGNFRAEVNGLNASPQELWTPVRLTDYAYCIMVGLGTIFIAALLTGVLLWWHAVFTSRWYLWVLILLLPFPYISNEAGWSSPRSAGSPGWCTACCAPRRAARVAVAAGETVFTLLGFAGMYALIGVLSLFLAFLLLLSGPEDEAAQAAPFERRF